MLRKLLLIIGFLAGCAQTKPEATPPTAPKLESESEIRKRLGIPNNAVHVLILSQSSHLDLDWRESFETYYTKRVEGILLAARKWLDDNQYAHYSIAEMAFLQHHLLKHPEEQPLLASHIKRGKLHLVGGGMTSPDTLLPETELLARDWMLGGQFAHDQLGARPWAAWLPDSFGHGAAVPDMLQAAGLHAVAMARIDGAPTLFEQIAAKAGPIQPSSTAAQLQLAGSADFVWRGQGGGEVLGHFFAGFGLYCQGDNLDYEEALQREGGHTGIYMGNSPTFTDAKIDHYQQELLPWTKTPYAFVPIGCDFASPKPKLMAYIEGYNLRQYAMTKTWVMSASFEDYAKLVLFHKDKLPVVQGELSPVYMGFYASRATLKRRVRQAARPYFQAEMLAAALGTAGRVLHDAARPTLSKLTRSDHHDYVTGTSVDAVVADEQLPQLAQIEAAGQSYLQAATLALADRIGGRPGIVRLLAVNASSQASVGTLEAIVPTALVGTGGVYAMADGVPLPTELVSLPGAATATLWVQDANVPPWGWRTLELQFGTPPAPKSPVSVVFFNALGQAVLPNEASQVTLDNGQVRAVWHRDKGRFTLNSVQFAGVEAIAAPSMLVTDYLDSGGLWRLGHEMVNCQFTPLPPAEAATQTVELVQNSPLMAKVRFVSADVTFEVSLGAGDSGLGLAVEMGASEGLTRSISLHVHAPADAQLWTSTPFGAVSHLPSKLFAPTFWPAVHWLKAGQWALALQQASGVRMDKPGDLELLAARDARSEQCDVMGGTGTDTGKHRFAWRMQRADSLVAAELAGQGFNRPVHVVAVPPAPAEQGGLPASASLASVTGDAVIAAIKPAEQAAGSVVRVLLLGDSASFKPGGVLEGRNWERVDLVERALGPLALSAGAATLQRKQLGAVVSAWGRAP